MATKTKKAAPQRKAKAKDVADVWVTNLETGLSHLVPAEIARTMVNRQDPVSGVTLYEAGSEPEVAEGYDHDDPDTHYLSYQDAENASQMVVTEAAYGVPDDAVQADAKAMAERGGQKKGSIAGPTIPQEARSDRKGKREAVGHPLAKGEAATGDVKAQGVDPEVAARHAAGLNQGPAADEDDTSS